MKKTTENNILLAEFLGSEIEETLKGKKVYCLNLPNKHAISGFKKEFFLIEELSFHNDWNWLMLVVHKCLTIAHEEMLNEWENSFADVFLAASIDIMYKEAVDFVKWYNNENK